MVSITFHLLLSLILCHITQSSSRVPSELPNPVDNPAVCGRSSVRKSSICDPDNMLNEAVKNTIEGYINAIKAAEVAVAVVSKISHTFIEQGNIDEASERFALSLHNRWGVGDKAKQNGILLFLSIGDRSIYISKGDGLGAALSYEVLLHNYFDFFCQIL